MYGNSTISIANAKNGLAAIKLLEAEKKNGYEQCENCGKRKKSVVYRRGYEVPLCDLCCKRLENFGHRNRQKQKPPSS